MRRRLSIRGTGFCVPKRVVTNFDLEKRMNTSDEFIVKRTGVLERRHVESSESLTDLMVPAVERALANAGLHAEEVDALIVSTLSPDYHDPSQACLLQSKVLRPGAPAFDIRAQCSGMLYGLELAEGMILSQRYRRVLLVCGEVLSKRMDCSDEGRNLSVLLGDGAAALVLECDQKEDRGLIDISLGADGRYFDLLQTAAPGSKNPVFLSVEDVVQGRHHFRMNGKPMFEHATATMVRATEAILRANRLSVADVDLVVPHQPNVRILEAVMTELGIPLERCVLTAERLGNMASASLPVSLAIASAEGRLAPGKLALFLAYGAGATWGAALYRS